MTRRLHVWSLCSLLAGGCGGSGSDDTSGATGTGTGTDATQATPGDTTGDPTGDTTGEPTSDSDPTDGPTADPTGGPTSTSPDPTGDTSSDPTGATTSDTSDTSDTSGGVFALPPPDGGLDYQLGGAYEPPAGVQIVSRDRNEAPAPGLYNICYVNGFQAQPDEESFWLDQHPDLVLRDENDDPVIDLDWDEMLLDTSTPEKRAALAEIVGGWITGCATAGYQAIEIDNLDSYSRSQDLLTQDHAVAFMALLSATAHASGVAIAQKNSTEILDRAGEMGTDFAVAEECNTYEECGDYIGTYGDAVLMIEYVAKDFEKGCADYPNMSIVLRDLNLTTPGEGAYIYEGC